MENTEKELKLFEIDETKEPKNIPNEATKQDAKTIVETLIDGKDDGGGGDLFNTILDITDETTRHGPNRFYDSSSSINQTIMHAMKSIKAYIYGLGFAFSMCMSSILIKMAPTLDGSNHSAMRYIIQMVTMLVFIKLLDLELLGPKQQRKLLIFRGISGSAAVITAYFSIKYLDISDVETLTNSAVIITALFSRIFLKEKLTMCHVLALIFTIIGVFFIVRPNFLFGIEEDLEHFFHVNLTSMPHLNQTLVVKNLSERAREFMAIKDHSNRELWESVIGVSLALFSAICMAVSQVAIRKLCLVHIHFSVTSLYPALVGLPLSLIISGYMIKQEISHKYLNEEMDTLIIQIVYSFLAGVFGTVGIIFLNSALKYEDATKIGILKTSGVLFSFFLQYIFLDITVDFLGILGAIFVIAGTISVMAIKLIEPKTSKSRNVVVKLLMTRF